MRNLVLYLELVFLGYLYLTTTCLPAFIVFWCLGDWFDKHIDWEDESLLGWVIAMSFLLLPFMPGVFLTLLLGKLNNSWIGWE
jgi:hypothetical protein